MIKSSRNNGVEITELVEVRHRTGVHSRVINHAMKGVESGPKAHGVTSKQHYTRV